MRVLHVVSSIDPQSGGPVAALVGLTTAQEKSHITVSILATWRRNQNLSYVDLLRDERINLQLVGSTIGPLSWHRQINATLHAMLENVDVVHIHGLWEQVQHLAATAAFSRRIPYVIRPCGMLDPWSLSQKKLKKMAYMAWRLRTNLDRAAAIHFTSRTERDQTKSLGLRTQSLVEPNGVDLSEFQHLPTPGTFRARYPSISDNPLIVFMGRIHPGKGLEYLVPAMAKVKPTNTVLAVVGPDSKNFRSTVEALVARHGLQDRVIFTNALYGADRVTALTDADLFALPSDHENFGVAVVESLAASTPVVISDRVNIHDQIAAAGVGGVVPTNIDMLAEELSRWLSDEPLRRKAAKAARPFVQENYDWRRIAQHWRDHYANFLAATQTSS